MGGLIQFILLIGLTAWLIGLVTQRGKKLEQMVDRRTAELQASQTFRDKMVANIGDVIVIIDQQGINRYKSPNIEKCFGWKPEDVTGSPALDNIHPADFNLAQRFITELMSTPEKTGTVECRYRCKDGAYKWIEFTGINLLHDPDINGILGNYHDITDRKKAAERIRDLINHLETIREEERKRLSRELHDDIGQILTALKIDLVMVQEEYSCAGAVPHRIKDMNNLLSEGMQSIHSLCRRLRPGVLDDLSLQDALEGLIADWQLRNQIECAVHVDADDGVLSGEIKTTVFRMVQESLANVSRHAHATRVDIHLVADEPSLNVCISDNGCGMETGATDKRDSFGLLAMRERLEAVGGTLTIESESGKGTRIEGLIPLYKPEA